MHVYQFEHLYLYETFKNKIKYIRGVNGGLSNVLSVHPSLDPSTKLDGSSISYIEESNRNQSDRIINDNSYNPHSIKWNNIMKF